MTDADKKVKIEKETFFVHGGFGKRVPKTDQNPNGWEECFFDLDKINRNKKTILYFGGNGTVEAGHANFGCKLVESLVGRAEENGFDLFGFYYSHEKTTKKYIDTKTGKPILDETTGLLMETESADNACFDEKQLSQIYNAFLFPLLVDENGNVFKENEIKKNLGNLRIFAYCKGSEETNKLLDCANEFLTKNFGEQKSKELLSNVFVVHFAPFKEPKWGTNVEFKSLRDYLTSFPNIANKQGWGFSVDEPFLGVAQTDFNKNKNGIEVFSNSFVSVEDVLSENHADAHSISNFLKIDGVIDRLALPGIDDFSKEEKQELYELKKQGKTGKRPQGYSRQQAISDLMSSALSYGLVHDKPNLDEIKMILDAQLKFENQIQPEKQQKKLFEEGMKKS